MNFVRIFVLHPDLGDPMGMGVVLLARSSGGNRHAFRDSINSRESFNFRKFWK